MRLLSLGVCLVAIVLIAYGCNFTNDTSPVQAPQEGPSFAITAGTETLNDIGIPLPAATGIIAAGVGMRGDPAVEQPADININVPGTVLQAFLYWEGQMSTNVAGDDEVLVNGSPVTGTPIGGPTEIVSDVHTSSFRADITSLVSSGANTLSIDEMDFNARCDDCRNDGASVVVLYDDGESEPCEIVMKDGNDFAYYGFAPTLDAVVPQTFNFAPSTEPREATLILIVGSVSSNRPNVVEVRSSAGTQRFVDELQSFDGLDWDTATITGTIPANVSSIEVELLSEQDGTSALTGDPASMVWVNATLCVPPPPAEGTSCTPGYYKNLKKHQHAWDDAGVATTDDFDTTFGVDYFNPDITLYDAINLGGGGVNKVARHGTAAYLNALHPSLNYPFTVAEVIAAVQAMDVDDLADANDELDCPLNNRSDVD